MFRSFPSPNLATASSLNSSAFPELLNKIFLLAPTKVTSLLNVEAAEINPFANSAGTPLCPEKDVALTAPVALISPVTVRPAPEIVSLSSPVVTNANVLSSGW